MSTMTKAILTSGYPNVESNMKKNKNKYIKYVSEFINSRAEDLHASAPYRQIYFSEEDVAKLYQATDINQSIIMDSIQHTYYWDIANFNPRYAKDDCTITLMCIVRYFFLNNMKKELDLALINLSFSGKFYPSIWYRSFPKVAPKDYIMDYVISNKLSNKYDIVKTGSVYLTVQNIAKTWLESYKDRFKKFTDEDVTYMVQQLHNRIGSFMNNIASVYYEAYDNKEYITYDSDNVSDDDYHMAASDSFKMNQIVQNTLNYINTHNVDQIACKRACNENVKIDELKSIIQNINNNPENMPLVKEYIELMVVTYFNQSEKKDVRNIEFISFCVKPKPNTKDKYIIRQKEVLNQILLNNSEHFARRRSRVATEMAYYRAINVYYALVIQSANS